MKKRLLATIPVLLVVFLCSFNVSASTLSIEERYNTSQTFLDGDLVVNTYANVERPRYLSSDYDWDSHRTYYGTSSQQYPANPYNWTASDWSTVYDVPIRVTITISNRLDYIVYGDIGYITMLPNITYNNSPLCYYVETVGTDLVLADVLSTGALRFRYSSSDNTYYGRFCVAGNGALNVQFVIHNLYRASTSYLNGTANATTGTAFNTNGNYIDISSITLTQPSDWNVTNVDAYANHLINEWKMIDFLRQIRDKFSTLLNAYTSNVSDAQTVTNDSNTNHNNIDSQYTTEMGYYTMANTDITNTGLSNFNLSADPVAGLGIVKNQFTYVWNKLSTYNIVYTFSLMLGIALMIIRHIKPIRRKQND